MVSIDGYLIDVVENEGHELSSDVTTHPVEQGADVADNVRAKPRELTLTNAVVSDTPIGTAATARQGLSTLPSQDALARLEQIWRDREPVTVVTNLRKYDSMVLDKLSITKEAKTFGGLVFTAHFVEVIIVQNKRVTVAMAEAGGQRDLGGRNALTDKRFTQGGGYTTKIPVASFPSDGSDSRTLQLHTMPIGQADGTIKRGILAAFSGPDDPFHQPTFRGNIEAYNTDTSQEQKLGTPAVGYPADGFVFGFGIGGNKYRQFRSDTDGRPLTYNQANKQFQSAGKPVSKSTSSATGSQPPAAPGNPANTKWRDFFPNPADS